MSRRLSRYLLLAAALGFTVYAGVQTEFNPGVIYRGFFQNDAFRQFISGLWPLNWSILGEVAWETLVTILIAWIGTLIATVISLPLSFAAARNVTPAAPLGSITRLFFNVDRSIDVLIVALIFVAAIGLGPLTGTLAIAIHSIGSMGKLFTEAIESIDRGPVEALESVGATRAQTIRWAVIPQVMPYLISYFLYRLELNIRSAVVLGIVGAGGIGYMLNERIRQFQYHDVSMILLVIVVLVMVIDTLSARLRKAVV